MSITVVPVLGPVTSVATSCVGGTSPGLSRSSPDRYREARSPPSISTSPRRAESEFFTHNGGS